MCGIIGVFNQKDSVGQVKEGLVQMRNRGRDGYGIASERETTHNKDIKKLKIKPSKNAIGHALHAIVGHVAQPIENKGKIVANCEIYNWEELNSKYGLGAENDADMVLRLIDKKGVGKIKEILDELDGDYAFCYWKGDEVVLARDLIGVKPLFYTEDGGFSFASEKKVLKSLGKKYVFELNPRKILVYDLKKKAVKDIQREFFSIAETKDSYEAIKEKTKELLIESIRKRIPKKKLGILFSGGVDSSTLALICKQLGADVTLYTAALEEESMSQAEDLKYAQAAAKSLGLKLRVNKIKLKDIPPYLEKALPIIEDSNVTKAGVALTFFPACELAKKDGCKVILSGLGSEEIFAGYQRHKRALDINKECVSGLIKLYERDTYRDDTVTMANKLELRVPFLDKNLINYALSIPERYKINEKGEKVILREIAEELSLKKEFAWRKKQAAQYGSKMDRAIKKLAKKGLKSAYLKKYYPEPNLNLAALISGGKDSLYAMYVMLRQNYHITDLISIKSENPDSYMFHTPAIDLVKLQSESLNIPLISQKTKGEKEDELKDLKIAIRKAKNIDGVITGALYSTYQRDRIEKICEQLGLKLFSPLWHIDQETEMREILKNKFNIIFTATAAEGLNSTWLGRTIKEEDIDKLKKINQKIGLNIAGEGGEFESLVLDMPMYKKKISIKKAKINMENEHTGRYEIEKAILERK